MLTTELVARGRNPRDILVASSPHPSIHPPIHPSHQDLFLHIVSATDSWFRRLGLLSFAITPLAAELLCAGGWEATEPSSAHHAHAEIQALLHLIGATVGP